MATGEKMFRSGVFLRGRPTLGWCRCSGTGSRYERRGPVWMTELTAWERSTGSQTTVAAKELLPPANVMTLDVLLLAMPIASLWIGSITSPPPL